MMERIVPIPVRPASAEALTPLARLFGAEEADVYGWRGVPRLPLETVAPAGAAIEDVRRLPEAERLLVAEGGAGFALVIVRGDRPEAWWIPSGRALALARGTWHSDPITLEGARVFEGLHAEGGFDRLDRASLMELANIVAVRPAVAPVLRAQSASAAGREPAPVAAEAAEEASDRIWDLLDHAIFGVQARGDAPEPTASGGDAPADPPPPPLDLALGPDLADCLHVGLLALDEADSGPPSPAASEALVAWSTGARAQGRRAFRRRALAFARSLRLPDPGDIPRMRVLRALRQGILPARAWEAALWRGILEEETDAVVVTGEGIAPPLRFARGTAGTTAPLPTGHRLRLDRVPTLSDAKGPLATLYGPLTRGTVGTEEGRPLVFAFFSGTLRVAEARERLDAIAARLPGRIGANRLFSGCSLR
jgi:hypothetical protein